MRADRTDEIINSILQLRIDIAKIDLKIDQAFRAIETASGKQTPKKPIKQHEEHTEKEWEELSDLGFGCGDVMRCPNCNEYVVIDKLKYCMECGQALNWND